MPIEHIDSKFKRKRMKIISKQQEFDVMEKRAARDAMERFREEPFQLRYAREHGKNRTK